MVEPEREHDAEVSVRDFNEMSDSRGPSGKRFVYGGASGSLTQGIETQTPAEKVCSEAQEKFDPDEFDHKDVVARIWVTEDREIEYVEWEYI